MSNLFSKWAYVPGRGECFVAEYLGNGCFLLISPHGEKLFIHRQAMRFLPGTRPKASTVTA